MNGRILRKPSIDECIQSSVMIEFPFPFRLDDGITGDRHAHARLEQDPREVYLRRAAAVHLPRIILVLCAAFGIGVWLIGLATAECVEREMTMTTLVEVQADAPAFPASVFGAAGLTQPDGQPACLSDRHAEARAEYDGMPGAPRAGAP